MPDTIRHRPRSIFRIGVANEFAQTATEPRSAEGANLPGGSRGMLPRKMLKFEFSEIAENAFNVDLWPLGQKAYKGR